MFLVKFQNYFNHATQFLSRDVRKRGPIEGIGFCLLRTRKSRNLIFTRTSISNLAFFAGGNAYPPPCASVGNKDGEARVSVKRWQCYHHQYVSRSYVLGPIRTIHAATHTRACQAFTT